MNRFSRSSAHFEQNVAVNGQITTAIDSNIFPIMVRTQILTLSIVFNLCSAFNPDRFKHGSWSEWGPWSGECSQLCHPDERIKETRTRSCSRKLMFCKGERKQTRSCTTISSYGCYPDLRFSPDVCGTRMPLPGADPYIKMMELLDEKVLSLVDDFYEPFVTKRIIRGHAPESEQEFPWLVQFTSNDRVICTGAMIASNLVLTAAHCFDDAHKYVLFVGKYHTERHFTEQKSQKLRIKNYTLHPDYDIKTADNDFAIVQLEQKAEINGFVNTICLPDAHVKISEDMMCFVAGWGTTAFGTLNYPKVLQEVYIPILKPSVCEKAFNTHKTMFTKNMICAGYLNAEADSCQGDSGAPLMCKKPSGQFFIGGLVSWGNGCAKKGFPGVYSRVPVAANWIESFMTKFV
ncbi:anionic trypsin-like isoform X2 [Convolutriloba macropyga]|uniref:anionic trypsin-like isoform X2 n=1 Tax=Convolutriloba macropyga TaxID=536237 RepID=UPI003F524681